MKAMLTFTLLLAISITTAAQSFFIGKDVDLLTGLRVVAKEKPPALQKYPYRGFFRKITKDSSPIIGGSIPYEELHGDTFVCTSVNKRGRLPYDRYILMHLLQKSGDTLYYYHDIESEYSFELTVLDEIRPVPGYYCKDVMRRVDKFDDSINWFTTLGSPVVYQRTRSAGTDSYLLHLQAIAELPDRGNDVILLLKSGNRVSMTCPMKMEVNRRAEYEASSACSLSPKDVAMLIDDPIASFRIFIYSKDVDHPERYSDMLRCIQKAE